MFDHVGPTGVAVRAWFQISNKILILPFLRFENHNYQL